MPATKPAAEDDAPPSERRPRVGPRGSACLFFIPHDRLLMAVGAVTGGKWLVPPLVDAWPVPGLLGPVPRLLVGLRLSRPALVLLALFHIAPALLGLLRVAAPVLVVPLAPAHLPHTLRC